MMNYRMARPSIKAGFVVAAIGLIRWIWRCSSPQRLVHGGPKVASQVNVVGRWIERAPLQRRVGLRGCAALFVLYACGQEAHNGAAGTVDKALRIIETNLDRASGLDEAFSLLKSGDPTETLSFLIDAINTGERQRQRAALLALGQMEWENPKPAFDDMRKLLRSRDGSTRGDAAIALASLGDDASYAVFTDMVAHDSDENARLGAAWALGELQQPKAIEFLRALPTDGEPSVAAFVSVAIERLEFVRDQKTEEAIKAARAISRIAGSAEQQNYRREPAMKILRSLDSVVTSRLLESWAADHSRPTISRSAEYALRHLDDDR